MQSAHICSKCGWGFPNPHPSAKQRRAHKKVCGKVEGFKIHESQVDDDQELSNKGEDIVNEEMDSGLIDRQISNKSEEEEFSDAVNEFAEPDLKGSTIASIMNATTLPMDGVVNSKKMETVTLEQKMSLTELHSGIRSRSTNCGASEKAYSSEDSFKDEDDHACLSDIENHNGSYGKEGSNNLLTFSNEELPEATVKDQNKNVPVKLEVCPTPDFSEATSEIEFQNPTSMDVHPGLSGKSVENTNVSPLATLDLEIISEQKEMCNESNMDEDSTTHDADISEAKDVYQGLDISTLPDLKFCDVDCSSTETNQMVCFEEQEPHYSQQDKPSKSLPPSLTESGDVIISPEPAIVHEANNAGSGKADSLHEDAKKYTPDISGKHIGEVAEDHSMQMKIGFGAPSSSFVELEKNLQKSEADSLHEDAKKDSPDISGKRIEGVAEDHSMQMKIGFGAPSSFVELDENIQKGEADSLHDDAKKDSSDISGKHIGGVAEDHSMQMKIGFGAPSSFVELEENLQQSESSPSNSDVQPSAVVINTTKLENMPEYLSESQNGHGKNLLEINGHGKNLLEISKEFEAERAETSGKETDQIEFVGADGSYDAINTRIIELAPSAVMSVPSALNSSSVEDGTEVLGLEDASDVSSSSLKEDDFLLDKQLEALATVPREGSVDSISQTDSVEGCWGSVSDGKIPSLRDAMRPSPIPAAEVLPGTDSQVPREEDQVPESKKTRSYEDQYSSHSDVCETPSILTLAESTGVNDQNLQQSHASSLQAAVNEKVTNWSSAKVRAPLKSFLVEPNFECSQDATAHGNPKSPASEDDATSKTSPPTASLEASTNNGLTKNIDKEWSSPARLPDSRQKRKTKWVPFLCCLSVN
ncbi:Pentatricopeptide repeat (PPR) superfamily protein [Thalictrum thalictroides]|uniref:Pentatricopeptide repeat (PPR) superfamily protein n=1 Tax=Thalictrum thalictroides TaxID=46969 RepID=A0A7J6VES1_THATH|nr:Pentatricopeptide repeat (PPR) superfamily protein [Thalictrum thalictroides]